MAREGEGQGQQSGGGNTEIIAVVSAFGAWIALQAGLTAFADTLFEPWRVLRQIELYPYTLLPDSIQRLLGLHASELARILERQDVTGWQGDDIRAWRAAFDDHVLPWISWVFAIPILYLGWRRMSRSEAVHQSFRNADDLLRVQARVFSHLPPLVDNKIHQRPLGFVRDDPNTWADAMNLSPEEFATLSPPLGLEGKPDAGPIWNGRAPRLTDTGWQGLDGFDRDLAERAFSAQIGPKFTSVDALEGVNRELFDRLAEHQVVTDQGVRQTLEPILGERAKGMPPTPTTTIEGHFLEAVDEALVAYRHGGPKGDILRTAAASAERILQDRALRTFASTDALEHPYRMLAAERIMARHGFERTGLLSLLEEARKGGVIPALWFRELVKPRDRTMWYGLSSVGRKVSFAESSGLFAHWLFETHLDGRAGVVAGPRVEPAVESLAKYLGFPDLSDVGAPWTAPPKGGQ